MEEFKNVFLLEQRDNEINKYKNTRRSELRAEMGNMGWTWTGTELQEAARDRKDWPDLAEDQCPTGGIKGRKGRNGAILRQASRC